MKVKEKVKSFYDKFFEVDEVVPEQKLSFAYEGGIDRVEEDKEFPSEVKIAFRVLKQIFLFFPGAFLLNLIGGGLTYFWLVGKELSLKPITWEVTMISLLSTFLVILGIGDIKRIKDVILPVSVLFIGSIAGFTAYLFTEQGDFGMVNKYILAFTPLALVMPFIAKFLIDKD